jgi:glycosidase
MRWVPNLSAWAALAVGTCCLPLAAQPLKLHVPSPDWREQIIYFVMTDRFADGDARNNDQGAGEFDPKRNTRYSGGDLKGLRSKLGYIQGLGATAVWLTPPVRNQWMDEQIDLAGYHGYWAQHFKQVDPHIGTLADYRLLSSALHRRGMYLVQDIVVNHVGNYFDYVGGWDAKDPTRFYTGNPRSRPTFAPTQSPFDLNDPRRAADRAAAVYHWTPTIVDVKNRRQETTYQLGGLDDLNTDTPLVRRALRDSHGWWIREAGVDAFRVDTAIHVEPDFFDDFLHARERAAAGIREVARRTRRQHFLVFGETFGLDRPGEDQHARRMESYIREAPAANTAGPVRERMDGMLNFPLYAALVDVFSRGRSPAVLADRVQRMMLINSRPHLLPTFVDNHDLDRWLAGGSVQGLEQALLAVMTLPGIPVIYYGTEQGFKEQRGAMFAAGFASGGRDRYDTTSPLYRRIQGLSALRRSDRVFTHGVPQMLQASEAGPGALAWRMSHEGRIAFVVMNTAAHPVLLDNLDTGLPAGTVLPGRYGFGGVPAPVTVGEAGRLHLTLPPNAGLVWSTGAAAGETPPGAGKTASHSAAADSVSITIDPLAALPYTGDFSVSGRAAPGRRLQLVVDGELDRAIDVSADAEGRFTATVATRRLSDPALTHRIVAWAAEGAASASQPFKVQLPWRLLAEQADPAGDDKGLDGQMLYPTDPTFAPRQMDLHHVRVLGAGSALRLELTMAGLSAGWAPPNGFDHVLFSIFIELPGQPGGATVMPQQHAELPAGMRWHVRLRAHGWTNAVFGPQGADAEHDGEVLTPAPAIAADPVTRTVRFTIPSATLGHPQSLSGARIYVTTWDYDGGWRDVARDPGPFTMGLRAESKSPGDPAKTPRVMDASAVITLP